MIQIRKVYIFFGILALFYAIQLIRLMDGDVLNNYPFITPDGFDWYTEGVYLSLFPSSFHDLPLYVLRPPLFVILCSLDYLVKPGVILPVVLSLFMFLSFVFTVKIVELINKSHINSFGFFAIILFLFFIPINYVREFLLAELLGVPLMIISTYFIFKFTQDFRFLTLVLSGVFAVFAGLTQTYGLIPFSLVAFLIFFKPDFVKFRFKIIAVISTVFLSYIILIFAWRSSVPHVHTPTNFGYLTFGVDPLSFLAKCIAVYILPFILVCFSIIRPRAIKYNFLHFLLCGILFIFLILNSLYNWTESRFLFIYVYLFPILLGTFRPVSRFWPNRLIAAFICMYFLSIFPHNFWNPNLNELKLKPLHSWYFEFFKSNPVDRGFSHCGNNCSQLVNSTYSDPYVQNVLLIYTSLINK